MGKIVKVTPFIAPLETCLLAERRLRESSGPPKGVNPFAAMMPLENDS